MTSIHEDAGSIPGLAMSCGIGRRCSLDLALLWLWCRPAATAPIRPLAWEPPCATGAALEKGKKTKKKKKKQKAKNTPRFQTKKKRKKKKKKERQEHKKKKKKKQQPHGS